MIKINISEGELVDRLTILAIKKDRIPTAGTQLSEEIKILQLVYQKLLTKYEPVTYEQEPLDFEYHNLKVINEQLWLLEEYVREYETNMSWDWNYIAATRAIQGLNTLRSMHKTNINILCGSITGEVKNYATKETGKANDTVILQNILNLYKIN